MTAHSSYRTTRTVRLHVSFLPPRPSARTGDRQCKLDGKRDGSKPGALPRIVCETETPLTAPHFKEKLCHLRPRILQRLVMLLALWR